MTPYTFDYNTLTVLLALKLWALSWLLTRVPVIETLRDMTWTWLNRQIRPRGWKTTVRDTLYGAISCHKCLSFWLILFVTANPVVALTAAALTDLLSSDRLNGLH